MDQLDEILRCKHAKVLIYGKECSGKSEIFDEIIRKISRSHSCCVFSNHDSIYLNSPYKNNIDFYHKAKDAKKVPMLLISKDAEFIFIEEYCDNYVEILKNFPNKYIFFVRTYAEDDKDLGLDKLFNFFIETAKAADDNHTPYVKSIKRINI